MEREYAIKFRHTNGTIHYTNVFANNSEDLFMQVENSGCEVLLWVTRTPQDTRSPREILAEYES